MHSSDYTEKLAAMMGGCLNPRDFRHRDHVGIAFEALRHRDFFDAARLYAEGLRSVAKRAGVPEKFNATITWAFLSLIAERMQAEVYSDAEDFLSQNGALLDKGLLSAWYSPERIDSQLAHRTVLLPDRPGAGPSGK